MSRFDYDIFVSYAHIDNEPIIEGESGWISEFHLILEKRLSMLLGEKPRIWRDLKLRGNDRFDDVIAEGFRNSALFVSVLSPRYVKSDYCRKEVGEFYNQSLAGGTIRVGGKSRMFRVVKTPVPEQENPQPLDQLLGYEFYHMDPDSQRIREFSVSSPKYREKYLLLLDDLAQEIVNTLGIMRNGTLAPAGAAKEKVVYLAPTSFDLKEAYDMIKRELVEREYTVLPDAPLPIEYNALKEAVQKALERSRLSIHLIGGSFGIIPENSQKSIIYHQNEIAAAYSAGANLGRIIWIAPDCVPTDKRQQEFIDYLKTDPGAQQNADLLIHSLDELKLEISAKLDELFKPEAQTPAKTDTPPAKIKIQESGGSPLWVYLMYGPHDAEAMASLEDTLWDENFEVRTPLLDESAGDTEIREEHEENLRLCDAFIIYYGGSKERWVRKILNDLKKIRGLGREKKILSKIIIIGPPRDERKQRFRTNEAVVIDVSGGDLGAIMPALLKQLKDAVKGVKI